MLRKRSEKMYFWTRDVPDRKLRTPSLQPWIGSACALRYQGRSGLDQTSKRSGVLFGVVMHDGTFCIKGEVGKGQHSGNIIVNSRSSLGRSYHRANRSHRFHCRTMKSLRGSQRSQQ